MTTTADGEEFTPRDAVEEIRRVEGYTEALRRRTSGLTWMIWGLVSPAIFLTYGFVGQNPGLFGGAWEWMDEVLWAPWVAMGAAATAALWRSVGLVIPVDRGESRRIGALSMVLFLGLIFLGFWVKYGLGTPLVEDAVVLIAMGVGALVIGATGLGCVERVERALWLAAGAFLVVTSLLASAAYAGAPGHAAHVALAAIAPAASAVAFFGGGLYLTLRG